MSFSLNMVALFAFPRDGRSPSARLPRDTLLRLRISRNMRLAIHHSEGSFSDRWEAYCDNHQIPYERVNCLATDIIRKLNFVDGLLWHWNHLDPSAQLAARHVLMAAEALGIVVFPSTSTCWHFDDKIAQKYLLEAVSAPLVPTYVFLTRKKRLNGSMRLRFLRSSSCAGEQVPQMFVSYAIDGSYRSCEARLFQRFSTGSRYWQDASKRYRAAQRRARFAGA